MVSSRGGSFSGANGICRGPKRNCDTESVKTFVKQIHFELRLKWLLISTLGLPRC